jgi:hypothetical protein
MKTGAHWQIFLVGRRKVARQAACLNGSGQSSGVTGLRKERLAANQRAGPHVEKLEVHRKKDQACHLHQW